MNDPTVAPDEVRKLEKLSLPSERFIDSYPVAYQVVSSAMVSHSTPWKLIKVCEDHIDGKKPMDQVELKKNGMGWVSNYNYGKARAKIEKGCAESTASISSSLALGYVTFRNFKDSDKKDPVLSFLEDDNKRGIVASVIGYALCSVLSQETRLSGFLNQVEYPSLAYGYCALLYDERDWMPEPTHPLNIAFRPNTLPEDICEWVVTKVVSARELYERWVMAHNERVDNITEEQNGTKRTMAASGWNLDGLENILVKAYRPVMQDTQKRAETWAQILPQYSKEPSMCIMNTNDVQIAKIYNKELNGRLTVTYIPYQNDFDLSENPRQGITPGVNAPSTSQILYQKDLGVFDRERHIGLVRDSAFSSKEGFIQDYRGIAKYSVEDSIRYNRQRNTINNKMQFIGAPMFEQPTTQTAAKFKVTVSQGFVLLPSSHSLVEKQPSFDINSHIAVLRFEEQEFNRDTQQFDASIQSRLTSRPNKGEVQQITQEVDNLNSAKNNIKLRDYSSIFRTVLLRMPGVKCKQGDKGYEGRRRFYDILLKQLSWLVKSDSDVNKLLKAIDSFIMDPMVTNVETITIAMQMAETPFGRNRLKRMLLIAKGMPIEEVNFTTPLIQDKFTSMQDARIALFENDMMFTTNEIIVAGTDDHIVHLDTHLPKAIRVAQAVQEGTLSPIDAFKYLENNLAHDVQHVELLGQDPVFNTKAQEYMQQIQELIRAKDQIRGEAERMMEAQARQAEQVQIDPVKANQIANDNMESQAKVARTDWLAQRRTEQAEQKIDIDREVRLYREQLEAQNPNR